MKIALVLARRIERFQRWADAYPIPMAERSGTWECDYRRWTEIYNAFEAFLQESPGIPWNAATMERILYIIARDNEFQYLVGQLRKYPALLLRVAETALAAGEPDVKWQLAVELSRLTDRRDEAEQLLREFVIDQDEYVRRRALGALADMGSAATESLAVTAWESGHEYQRMMALAALRTVGSPLLDHYLVQAETDGRQYLVGWAAHIRAGEPDC